ncbi:XRE family transcriptional regulator [Streptococcus constellatus]|uniref:PF06114 domain protein n=1 Tax=Streptococcus constellatus subsp. constellatus SK53 TaxID=1095730 RepID=A0AAD2Y3T3_STRCV|nr:XRE family transcriptional regulator [Streptococcus constellatus]EID18639.1 PF06114 domain protein [Streptococcus constellatus subsp. constellatus SK53]MDP1485890.1 XRE family transcriptional regulator [Streptococcus constellatus]QQT05335.1 XRE family transcriptional regulator [Streptococcus constellatus]SUN39850.1 transcriptional regulator [Streptococcus constellatus]BBD21900.1 DNA-binding protein [Streptococcus constellatus subsp. constellatus]
MFNGQVLKELRLLNGMSRADLAQKMDLTEQAIWQFESNTTQPKLETRLQLANQFYVDLTYFEQEEEVENFDISAIAFRNADLSTRKTIDIQTVYLHKIDQFIDYLEGFVIIPNITIYDLSERTNKEYQAGKSIEEISLFARNFLEIAEDNHDILYKIERSGVYVSERLINGQADAYSAWSKSDRPYIVLGTNKSAVRRNFDLAHELGHLLLHKSCEKDENLELLEQEANFFASCFLLPKNDFFKVFTEKVGKRVSNPDSYVSMKVLKNVSIQALEYRAFKLGLLTPQQHSYFYRQIAKKKYKVVEPLDEDIPIRRPSKVKSILDVILTNGLASLTTLTSQHKVHLKYISELFSFDTSFFDKYKESSTTERLDNIIPLLNGKKAK